MSSTVQVPHHEIQRLRQLVEILFSQLPHIPSDFHLAQTFAERIDLSAAYEGHAAYRPVPSGLALGNLSMACLHLGDLAATADEIGALARLLITIAENAANTIRNPDATVMPEMRQADEAPRE